MKITREICYIDVDCGTVFTLPKGVIKSYFKISLSQHKVFYILVIRVENTINMDVGTFVFSTTTPGFQPI